MILIITNKDDLTTDYVVNELNKMGVEYFRFNTEDISHRIKINIDFAKGSWFYDKVTEMTYPIKNFKSVYYRRPGSIYLKTGVYGLDEYINTESNALLDGLYRLLDNKFWVSNVFKIRAAENKIYQLSLAKEIGFNIPNTYITNVIDEANKFCLDNTQVVTKNLKARRLLDAGDKEKIFHTGDVDTDKDNLDSVEICPTLLQEKIKKKFEYRVVVVGTKIYAFRINSQDFEETKTDWRLDTENKLNFEIVKIQSEIQKKCLLMTSKLGLQFGAFDLAETQTGDFVFFEINPNGQWGWLQYQLGANIASDIASLLISKPRK
jgi:glutathione synthase/RimK-type ligase-like ATP-grasp enzyme